MQPDLLDVPARVLKLPSLRSMLVLGTNKVGVLPVSRKVKYSTIRAVGVSMIAYGWVARAPAKQEIRRFDSQVFKPCREPVWSGRHHKRLLLTVGLDLHVGLRQCQRTLAARARAYSRALHSVDFFVSFSEKHALKWLETLQVHQGHLGSCYVDVFLPPKALMQVPDSGLTRRYAWPRCTEDFVLAKEMGDVLQLIWQQRAAADSC